LRSSTVASSLTPDVGGTATTAQFGDAVLAALAPVGSLR
jgi:hypothetical protein